MITDVDADTWAAEHEGRILDERYQIETLLGAGGMGAVFRGQQLTLRKPVAIKLLRPEYAGRKVYRDRFLREARAASRIGHRNVVDISDFGETERGEVFFVMELLDGEDLSQRLRRAGALPWRKARVILRQIIRGLRAAHERDVIHRDIKPANVFLVTTPEDEPDEVKLLDFGVAKVTDPTSSDAAGLTSADKIMGTAMFMAPEQALGKNADARADVYAVGCIAYQMLAGRPAYPGVNAIEILMRRLNEPPPSLRDELPHVPPAIEAFVRQAMARDPVGRFQSMAEMEEALRQLPNEIVGEKVPTVAETGPAQGLEDATATGVRGSSSAPNPSAVPTIIAPRSEEHGGGTAPNPQPSTANQRRLTEPMSVPRIAAAASGPQLPPPVAAPEPRRRSGLGLVVAIALLVAGAGAGAWYVTTQRVAPTTAAAAPTTAPATAPATALGPAAPVAAVTGPSPEADSTGHAPTQPGSTSTATESGTDAGTESDEGTRDGGEGDEATPPGPPVSVVETTKAAAVPKTSKKKPPKAQPTRDLSVERGRLATKIRKGCTAESGAKAKISFNVEPNGRTGVILVRGVGGEAKTCITELVRAFRFTPSDRVDSASFTVEY